MSYKYNPFTGNLDIVGSGHGGGSGGADAAELQAAIGRITTLEGMVAVNNISIDELEFQLSALAARVTALENP